MSLDFGATETGMNELNKKSFGKFSWLPALIAVLCSLGLQWHFLGRYRGKEAGFDLLEPTMLLCIVGLFITIPIVLFQGFSVMFRTLKVTKSEKTEGNNGLKRAR